MNCVNALFRPKKGAFGLVMHEESAVVISMCLESLSSIRVRI